jgi:hypothetical protein
VDKSDTDKDPNDTESADPDTANTQSMPNDLNEGGSTAAGMEVEAVWPEE